MGTHPRSRLGVAVVILGLAACYTELGGHYSVHSASPSPIAPQSAPQAPPTATSDDLAAIEKEMAVHPLESFAIARRALDAAASRPETVKRLFTTAARLLEERLALLNESQVEELAQVHAKALGAPKSAEAVRKRWLKIREEALGPADGPGRLNLAQLYHKWLKDRQTAARLCQEAFHVAPDLTAADRMLRDELGYHRTETGWQAQKESQPLNDPQHRLGKIQIGMSAATVLKIMGQPSRTARQILYRRYREQWFYDHLPDAWIDFDCFKGQDAHVTAVHVP